MLFSCKSWPCHMKKDARAYAGMRKNCHLLNSVLDFKKRVTPGSHTVSLPSPVLQQQSPGKCATGMTADKQSKAKLHLVLARCVPCPMSSFHSPKERRAELYNSWLKFSNHICFPNWKTSFSVSNSAGYLCLD